MAHELTSSIQSANEELQVANLKLGELAVITSGDAMNIGDIVLRIHERVVRLKNGDSWTVPGSLKRTMVRRLRPGESVTLTAV